MTDTDRMVVWLRETMDAAQRDAEAAAERAWSPHWEYDDHVNEIRDLNNGNTLATIYHPEIGAYVAANGPAAVLLRIAADRKLLELHHDVDGKCAECAQGYELMDWGPNFPCQTIRHVAEGWGWTGEEQR